MSTPRTVTVYNSVGQAKREVTSSADTWNQLQRDLDMAGIPYSQMKSVVGETRNTLESGEAQLPQGNFTLFLLPTKVKSGVSFFETANEDFWEMTEQEKIQAKLAEAISLLQEVSAAVKTTNYGALAPDVRKLAEQADSIKREFNIFD